MRIPHLDLRLTPSRVLLPTLAIFKFRSEVDKDPKLKVQQKEAGVNFFHSLQSFYPIFFILGKILNLTISAFFSIERLVGKFRTAYTRNVDITVRCAKTP